MYVYKLGKFLYRGLNIHGISRISDTRFSFFINSLNSLLNSWLLSSILLAVGELIHYRITCRRPENSVRITRISTSELNRVGAWPSVPDQVVINDQKNLLDRLSIVIYINTWWFVIFIRSVTGYENSYFILLMSDQSIEIVVITSLVPSDSG